MNENIQYIVLLKPYINVKKNKLACKNIEGD